ncbi:hypothetical protein HGG75_18655 [Ochrobactrum pseudogrignonense]|nr:hypothetical protein [Brucella pseudogrignonensis]
MVLDMAGRILALGLALSGAARAGEWLRSRVNLLVGLICLAVAIAALYFSAGWQNSVRAVMGMEPVPSAYPASVCGLAVITF